jgi:hypothetical protein
MSEVKKIPVKIHYADYIYEYLRTYFFNIDVSARLLTCHSLETERKTRQLTECELQQAIELVDSMIIRREYTYRSEIGRTFEEDNEYHILAVDYENEFQKQYDSGQLRDEIKAQWIAFLRSFMLHEEDEAVVKKRQEEAKVRDREREEYFKRAWAAKLKSPDELPDIDADEIIITLREEEKPHTGIIDDADIVLYWQNKELWREVRLFEYYGRYLELGKILIEKYGKRLIDFETEYPWALGGDYGRAFDEVRKFRKSLSDRCEM